jgi:5'(3')-deoxyribonucleotidase
MGSAEIAAAPVLVDLDGTVNYFDQLVLTRLVERHPEIVLLPERKNFYVGEDYPRYHEDVMEIIHEKGFFKSIPLIESAVRGLHRILAEGFSMQICSSPIQNHLTCHEEKIEWITKYFVPEFGPDIAEEAIITRQKEECDGIALIDDRPGVSALQHFARWRHIMFDQPYNRVYEASMRLHGWDDRNLPYFLHTCNELYTQAIEKV